MVREIRFEAWGVRIGVGLCDERLLAPVIERFPPGWMTTESRDVRRCYRIGKTPGHGWSLVIDGSPAGDYDVLDALLDALEGDIQLHVAEFAAPHLFIHAGVVAWNGRAILLPGSSFAGKSTLVMGLVMAGATYYSDEYAALDEEGRVLPYPRRVSLRQGPFGPQGRIDLSHAAPQESEAERSIPVGLVALLRYAPVQGWEITPASPLEGLMAMGEQTVAIRRRSADTMSILGKITAQAQVIHGTRGDIDESVSRLLSMVEVDARLVAGRG